MCVSVANDFVGSAEATSESSPPSGDNAQKCSIGIDEITASEQVEPADLEEEDDDDEVRRQQLLNAALAKRLSRNERLDNRRYHTAGAIEDIKVSEHTSQVFDSS